MPELPEVETVVRGVRPYLVGRRIRAVEVLNPAVCAFGALELRRAVVEKVGRRGKYILLHLARRTGRPVLVFHLGMSGQLLLLLPQVQTDRHTHLVLRLTGLTDELRFRDVRRFGGVCLYRSATELESAVLDRLGPEADTLTSTDLARVAWTSSRPIKPLLMDQGKVAGLGNIYTDESLWRARLHPLRPSVSLSADELRELARAIRTVLRGAIRYHGSTVDDFRAPDGSPGRYQERLAAYGRQGHPCPRCGSSIVRIRLQGRGTHFCPRCQPAPSAHTSRTTGGSHAD